MTSRPAVLGISLTALFVLALAAYGWQAAQTPLLNGDLAARDRYLARIAKPPAVDTAAERAAALDYWRRYPDVANDSYYGRNGPLGWRGARQHYLDHGRRERRQWKP